MTEAATRPKRLEVGTIVGSSWGYDQTNVNYYQVVKRTPKMVVLRPIGKRTVSDDGGPVTYVEPDPNRYNATGEADFRRKIALPEWGDDEESVRISGYEYAFIWDGSPDYETGYGWGH